MDAIKLAGLENNREEIELVSSITGLSIDSTISAYLSLSGKVFSAAEAGKKLAQAMDKIKNEKKKLH